MYFARSPADEVVEATQVERGANCVCNPSFSWRSRAARPCAAANRQPIRGQQVVVRPNLEPWEVVARASPRPTLQSWA